jgi:ParB-like chromosome segregation protein Spo0J
MLQVPMAKHINRKPVPPNIDIQIERWPIERLIPRANNPRTHSPAQIAAIAASIQEFGWTNPVLVGAGIHPARSP